MSKPSMEQGKHLLEMLLSSTREKVQELHESGLLKLMLEAPNLKTVDKEDFKKILWVNTNPYTDEKVTPRYSYPDGYQPKTLEDQRVILQKLYPKLTPVIVGDDYLGDGELLQLVPKLSAIAKLNGIEDPYGAGYGKCLEVMLSHISSARKFHNYREGRLTEKHVRLLQSTREVLEKLEAETPGDYLVVPMQSGHLYGGYSPRNARWEIENNGQWALPAWVVGHHLLTHPERCVKWEELEPDCAGDEYSPDAVGSFESSLDFCFYDGELGFGFRWADDARDYCGTASGFLRE